MLGWQIDFLGLDGRLSSLTYPEYDLSKSRIPAAPTNTIEILISASSSRDTLTSTKEVYVPYQQLNEITWFTHFFLQLRSFAIVVIFNFNLITTIYLKFQHFQCGILHQGFWVLFFVQGARYFELCLEYCDLSVDRSICWRSCFSLRVLHYCVCDNFKMVCVIIRCFQLQYLSMGE